MDNLDAQQIDQIVKYLGYDKKPELMARIYGQNSPAAEAPTSPEVDLDELARLTRQQGMGGIFGSFVKRVDPRVTWDGQYPGLVFLMGQKAPMEAVGQLDLRASVPDQERKTQDQHILQIGRYDAHYSEIPYQQKQPMMVLRQYDGKHGEDTWTRLQFVSPLKGDFADRPGAYIAMFVVIPPLLARQIVDNIEKDKTFVDKYFRTVFPSVIGTDPKTSIQRPPASRLLILAEGLEPQTYDYPQPIN